ncbi:MAG: DegT/DnrJ/EryC1/StrS family aminotransferase [Solirubrobacteraceae bacterium]
MTAPVPFLDLRRATAEIGAQGTEAVERVLASGRYVLGDEVDAFEREFAAACGARWCVGVGNGFDALALILRAWEIGPGDDVLVPALTAVATWMAVAAVGARPVPVDVDARTLGMDPESLRQAVGPRARAVIPVHLHGIPVDMDAVAAVAREHRLRVLEDAAQAAGARWRGAPVGSLGDAAAFSFYPTKNLAAVGDGGAVVTDDGDLAARVRVLRQYGCRERERPERLGVNSRLDELQAALLRLRLVRLEAWNERRRRAAGRYLAALGDLPGLAPPGWPADGEPSWHVFAVQSDRRDALRAALAERGIETLIHFPRAAVDAAPFADWGRGGAAPRARRAAGRVLSLPLHPHLEPGEQDAVIAALRAAV